MATRPKGLYLSKAPQSVYDVVRATCGQVLDLSFLERGDDQERTRLIGDAEVVIVAADRLSAGLLRSAGHLRLVHHQGVGYQDTIDLAALRHQGARLALTRHGTTQSVAEHAVLLALAVLRRLPFLDASTRRGEWHINTLRSEAGMLAGRTVGYLGMGHIGRATATLFKAFGTRGLYFDQAGPLSPELEAALELSPVDFDSLLSRSDIVSIHIPLTGKTRGLIGRQAIGRMKPGAILLNTARGGVVDTGALAEALRSGRLGGAGLDVFDPEPPPADSPLFAMRNVVVTPHVAAATIDAFRSKMEFIARNTRRFLERGELEDEVPMSEAG